jgi:hypothetical protein
MPEKSLKEQQDDLMIELGFLVDPIRRLLDSQDCSREAPYIESQWCKEVDKVFIPKLEDFVSILGIKSSGEHLTVRRSVYRLRNLFSLLRDGTSVANAKEQFEQQFESIKRGLREFPCQESGTILPGLAPLSTYRRLLSICRTSSRRIDLFDPYLDKAVYLLYLDEVDQSVQITVITSENNMRNASRRDRIVAVSELLALQRPATYQLRVTSKQHDRHLRIDDQLFHLGGSIKDAGKQTPYTISSLDSQQSNHDFLDSIISSATEWFGPTVTSHRQEI